MELLKGKGFFNKQKDDPEYRERQKRARNSLLKNLSRAVKEVQLLSTRTEKDWIGDCRAVQRLCARFEDVLRHNLKAGWTGKTPTFWPVVLKISRRQAIEYINRLQYAQSENGRCRAWIRMAVNESSLESYITVLCQDTNLLSQYFEVESFLRDEDTVFAMKQLLTGISGIQFKITVDTADLEFALAPEALQPALRIRAPLPMEGTASETSGPSSTSTPQASSDGSWCSNSSSSSSTHHSSVHSTREGGVIGYHDNTKAKVDEKADVVVKMDGGLEASLRQEDDSIVIEAPGLTKVNAYSNLKRFSMALEDTNDDWLAHQDYNEGAEEDTTGDVDNNSSNEGIHMKVREPVVEGGAISSPSDSPLARVEDNDRKGNSNNVQPPTQDQLVKPSTPTRSPLRFHSPDSSPSLSGRPVHQQSPNDSPLHSSPPLVSDERNSGYSNSETSQVNNNSKLLEKSEPHTSSPHKTPSPPHQTPSPHKTPSPYKTSSPHVTTSPHEALSSPHKTPSPTKTPSSPNKTPNHNSYTPEEYSFTEVLRLAAGVGSKSSPKSSRSTSTEPDQHQWGDRGGSNNTLSASETVSPTEVDPYAAVLNEDQATPKAEYANPFLSSINDSDDTNPFVNGYKEPTPPTTNSSAVTVATYGNPFEEDSSTFGQNGFLPDDNEQTFGNHFDQSHPSNDQFNEPRPSNDRFNEPRLSKDQFGESHASQDPYNPFDDEPHPFDEPRPSQNPGIMFGESIQIRSSSNRSREDTLVPDTRPDRHHHDIEDSIIQEDHYDSERSIEEIEVKLSRLKSYWIKDMSNAKLQKQIVDLQLLKQKKLEAQEEERLLGGEVIFGHTFQEVSFKITGKKCDVCNKPFLLKKSYKCANTGCKLLAHEKCLNSIKRKCVSHRLKSKYIMDVRPEKGLTHQFFRCDCCNQALNTASVEVRLCDYTGLYYCSNCHHNDMSLIPARILHNWDFTQRTVCCFCAKLLSALETRPLIDIHLINPWLYKYISDLREVEAMRKDILQMKTLLAECDRAKDEDLIKLLDKHPHFKDSANLYSVEDMIGLQNGSLLKKVQIIHKLYFSHVNQECENCLNHGKSCCICRSSEKLFKFSKGTVNCQKCLAIFHKNCSPNSTNCPVCTKQRKSIF